jgi:hypothetical protein
VICTQPHRALARAALAAACGVFPIYGTDQSRGQWSKVQEANTQPVEESVTQLLPESFLAAKGKPQSHGEAKAAATNLVKPFGTSPKEGRFWPERRCSAKVWRRRQLAVQSRAAAEKAKGQRQQGQEQK